MKIIEVIPISKAIKNQSLSYFSSKKISPGSVVMVPLHGKNVPALVLECLDVSTFKSELRSKEYALKKIADSKVQKLFSLAFIEAVKKSADFFTASIGSTLYALWPQILFELQLKSPLDKALKAQNIRPLRYLIQSSEDERFADYRSIIREHLAKGQSVFIISPTNKLAEKAYQKIEKGLTNLCFLLHSSLKKSELKENLKKVVTSKKAIAVSTTPKFLSVVGLNLGAIIVEKENSYFYKNSRRPFIDSRIFAEFLAEAAQAKLFLGGLYLRTETQWRLEQGEFIEFKPLRRKVPLLIKETFVDMKKNQESNKKITEDFKVISPALEKIIKKALREQKKIFLLGIRLGLHPLTICGHCGEMVACGRCGAPLVLHSLAKKNFFLCHKCGRRREAEGRCQKCQSWKLVPLGIGLELIEKRLKGHFAGLQVFRIDGDRTPTPTKAKKVAKEFYQNKGGLLIGTEMAVNYLEKIDYAGVVSLDSLFSVPDFRINEKIINLLLSIREKTEEEFLIQTRQPDQEVLVFAKAGNLSGFYRNEIKERQDFGFPPFFTFIKISFSGKKEEVLKESQKLKDFFSEYDFNLYPSFTSSIAREKVLMNGLIRIPAEAWPDANLKEKLLALPQKFNVDVNPSNIL